MFLRVGKEDIKVSLKDAGTILFYSGMSFFVPILLSIVLDRNPTNMIIYCVSALGLFNVGFFLKNKINVIKETEPKHALLSIVIVWLIFCTFTSIPFILILKVNFLSAFFESMSALTTTGLTKLTNFIDLMPPSLILWRNFLGWIGGIGIVLMAFMGLITTYSKTTKLLSAEGRGDHLKENLKTSVSKIAIIYIGMTILGVVLLLLTGQTMWEAVNYSMTFISTNGMDITTAGIASGSNNWVPLGENNYWSNLVMIFIMIIGATSFELHYLAIKKKEWGAYFRDPEFRTMILIGLIGAILITTKTGILTSLFHSFAGLSGGGLALVSTDVIANWMDYVKIILIIIMVIGGSAGSTTGGIKTSRFIIFCKSIFWKIKQSLLPTGSYFKRSYHEQQITNQQIREINQFILLWIIFLIIGTVVITSYGYPLDHALFEVVSAQSNVGLSTGITEWGMPLGVELMLLINMFVGRLEIIPIIASVGLLLSLKKSTRIKNYNTI